MQVVNRLADLSKRQVLLLAAAAGTVAYAGHRYSGKLAEVPSNVHSLAGDAASTAHESATGDGE